MRIPKILRFGKIDPKDLKENPLKAFAKWFSSLDLFTKLILATFALIIISTPFIANNIQIMNQRASPPALEQSKQMTLAAQDKVSSSKKLTLELFGNGDLKKLAKDRKEQLESLIEQDPQEFLRIALPKTIKDSFPDEIKEDIEEETDLEGDIEVLHSDDFEKQISKFYYFLNSSNKRYSLYFADQGPGAISGSKVKIKGVRLDDKIAIELSKGDSFKILKKQVLGVTTVKKIAVILFNFQNDIRAPFTQDAIRSSIFLDPSSAYSYYKEISYSLSTLTGKLRTDGDVFGWYTIPYDNVNCSTNYSTWAAAANNQAQASGVDLSGYTNYVYVFPNLSCGWSGIAYLPGSKSWINGTTNSIVISHELGHNFGVHHASSLSCADSSGKRVTIGNTCTANEYGDPFDIMGSGNFHMNNYHKGELNWYDSSNTQTITASGIYSVSPIEKATANPVALIIPRDKDVSGNILKYYYLEYRQPYGLDLSLNSNVLNGVSIRLSPPYNTISQSLLIDATPQTSSFSDSALAVGNTFVDPIYGITVNTLGVSSSNASVQVTFGPLTCVKSSPTVSLSPLGQFGAPGQTVSYALTVLNNDTSACSASSFNIIGSLPSGFTQTSNSSITLNPGATSTSVINITSSSAVTEGFYSFSETAVNSANSIYKDQELANYNVISATPSATPTLTPINTPTPSSVPTPTKTPIPTLKPSDTTPPIVSIISLLSGAIVHRNSITAIAVSASDNVAVSRVEILVGSNLLCKDTLSPYTCSWSVPAKPNVSYTISARAYDASGNSSISSIKVTAR